MSEEQDMSVTDSTQAVGSFDGAALLQQLEDADGEALDRLPYGIVRLDRDGVVVFYNRAESMASGLSAARVLGRHFFSDVGPCMNNFMVASRFQDEADLDCTLDYVFTLRMRPTPVRMRLLKAPGARFMYLVVQRV
jgi:photoactive yellow protein